MIKINFSSVIKCILISCICNLSAITFATAQYFTKLTTGPFVNTAGDSRSVNWIDANNDGWIDCFISNGPQGGQNNQLFLNNGTGNFTALVNDSLVLDNTPSDGATWADVDNDGDLDCFVANWYNINNLFYLNNGNATFTKITTGDLVNDGGYSETASWGDYDNDGLVDLYVSNSAGLSRNFLYHNDGNNTFTKITSGAIVTNGFASRSVNWTDIDNDGDLDVFVTNENNQNENIYRNDSVGVFTKLSTGVLLNDGKNSMSSSWADYDNDGDMDVFIANEGSFNALYANDGNFNFTKITNDTLVTTPSSSFSSAWSDVDNDGDLDLFVTNAFSGSTKLNNYFYINDGAGHFTREGNSIIATDSSWSYGCAFGDYDNDGFEDLAVATCRFNGIDEPDFLYRNVGNTNNWITIKLTGAQTNKSAIGTKIRLRAVINGNVVWQMREISAQTSYCGQNDLRAHFGLANATVIDSIIIEWPTGTIDICTNIFPNAFYTAAESQCLVLTTINEVEIPNRDFFIESVFPNPVIDKLSFKFHNEKQATITISIINVLGKVVLTKTMAEKSGNNTLSLDVKKLKAGVYTLLLKNEKQSCEAKFIKQ